MPAPRNAAKPRSRVNRREVTSGPKNALIDLPAEGCALPVPPMPKGRTWTKAEKERWQELWESPQATQWDDTVKGTVGVLIAYESAILAGEASAWQAQECRYAAEALGLTPRALGQLGWRITDE